MDINAKNLYDALLIQLQRNQSQKEAFKAEIEYRRRQIAEAEMEVLLREKNCADLQVKIQQLQVAMQPTSPVQ